MTEHHWGKLFATQRILSKKNSIRKGKTLKVNKKEKEKKKKYKWLKIYEKKSSLDIKDGVCMKYHFIFHVFGKMLEKG